MMQPNRRRQNQKRHERNPAGAIRIEFSSSNFGKHHIEHYVSWQQPEVNKRMPEKPEQRSREYYIDRIRPSERPGNQKDKHFICNGQCAKKQDSKRGQYSYDCKRRFL